MQGNINVQCTNRQAAGMYAHQVYDMLNQVKEAVSPLHEKFDILLEALRNIPEMVAPCDFEGMVEGEWESRNVFTCWCPQCGDDIEQVVDDL